MRSCIGRADDILTGRELLHRRSRVAPRNWCAPATVPRRICSCWTNCFAAPTQSSGSRRARPSFGSWSSAASRPKPHVVLAATHDGELVDLLSDVYAAYHFGDAVARRRSGLRPPAASRARPPRATPSPCCGCTELRKHSPPVRWLAPRNWIVSEGRQSWVGERAGDLPGTGSNSILRARSPTSILAARGESRAAVDVSPGTRRSVEGDQ